MAKPVFNLRYATGTENCRTVRPTKNSLRKHLNEQIITGETGVGNLSLFLKYIIVEPLNENYGFMTLKVELTASLRRLTRDWNTKSRLIGIGSHFQLTFMVSSLELAKFFFQQTKP